MAADNDDYEVMDVDAYIGGEKDKAFSHQLLVMAAMRRALDSGNKEMRQGYWNEKADRFGNKIRTYIPDTRLEFINSVEMVEINMAGDLHFDNDEDPNAKDIKKNIQSAKDHLEEVYKDLCELEKKDFDEAPPVLKKQRVSKGLYHREGSLNKNYHYYQEYIEEQVQAAKDILKELVKLTHVLGFYQQESLEN